MKKYLEQLTPQERRIVVGAGVFVFLLLNYFFVWGHFGEWGQESARMINAEKKLKDYGGETAYKGVYETKIKVLEAGGGQVSTDDPGIDLLRYFSDLALQNQVTVINNSRPTVHTNSPYLIEREVNLQVHAKEPQLVNFLYSLGSGNSAVRVKSMTLRPDGVHQQLNAGLSIVASYQTKPTVRGKAPAGGPESASPAAPAPGERGVPKPAGPGTVVAPAKLTNAPVSKPGLMDRLGSFFGRKPAPTAPATNHTAPVGPRPGAATNRQPPTAQSP